MSLLTQKMVMYQNKKVHLTNIIAVIDRIKRRKKVKKIKRKAIEKEPIEEYLNQGKVDYSMILENKEVKIDIMDLF